VIVGLRGQFQTLREEAFAELSEADGIYRLHPRHHGAGAVHLNCGFLHLDSGDLERAAEEASAAFSLGQEKKDYILMSRARILECMVANARLEEEIGEPAQDAQHAYSAARQAVEYAGHTQNRRLIARARIWEGLTLSNDFFGNIDGARECAEAAESLLKTESRDYLGDDLETLKRRLVRPGSVERVLEEWSQGIVGDKTFQQITEEFAAVVIPKVWEREGRKVSRVAAKLSISPKKVRRILSRLGLLQRGRVH
jgi:tetratricopeptide (TPR) repeat protein